MYAPEFAGHLTGLADQLTAAGITASTDPRNLNPPCAWVSLDTLVFDRFGGDASGSAVVLLIAADAGMPTAADTLAGLLNRYLSTPGLPIPTTCAADTAALPSGGGPLPALRLTLPIGD